MAATFSTKPLTTPLSPADDSHLSLGNVGKITVSGDIYDLRTGVLARSAVIFGLQWQCIGFLIVVASLYKLPIRGKGATHLLFWISMVCITHRPQHRHHTSPTASAS